MCASVYACVCVCVRACECVRACVQNQCFYYVPNMSYVTFRLLRDEWNINTQPSLPLFVLIYIDAFLNMFGRARRISGLH